MLTFVTFCGNSYISPATFLQFPATIPANPQNSRNSLLYFSQNAGNFLFPAISWNPKLPTTIFYKKYDEDIRFCS